MFRYTVSLVILGLMALSSAAQTKFTDNTLRLDGPDQAGKASLADVAWFQGIWKGEGLGGQCDETWSPAAAGSMVGTFRLMKNDKLVFSEFMMMVEENGTLTIKIKHFHPDMKGWEEKDKYLTFPLVKVEPKAAYFNGLTYRKNDDGTMTIYLAMKRVTGTTEEKFTFKPVVANAK